MSELFKVLTKLLGLFQLFSSMSLALNILALTQNFAQSTVRESIIFILLKSLVLLGFSLALVFKTEWVASFVGVGGGTDSSTLISARSLLKAGIILVGLNVLLPAMFTLGFQVSPFISLSSELFATSSTSFQKTQVLVRMLSEALPATLSLFCVFGSEKVIQLIEKFGTEIS
jgi:hypothetical protein